MQRYATPRLASPRNATPRHAMPYTIGVVVMENAWHIGARFSIALVLSFKNVVVN